MKETGKRILSALVFVVFLLVIIRLFSGVFVPKDNGEEDGIQDARVYGILGEPTNTIDVLVLGDSLGECAVNPVELWRNCGITSYVCCSGNQTLYQSTDLLELVLKSQTPRVVLMEANAVYAICPKTDIISNMVENWLPLLRYHDRWKSLQISDWTGKAEYTHTDSSKGFHISREIQPADTKNYMKPSKDAKSVGSDNLRYVREMMQTCENRGIQLILFSAPSTTNWDYRHHNGIARLAKNLGLTYIDMNLMDKEIPIDWETDTMDWGNHMNCSGAAKVTGWLGGYLTETGLFADKRNDANYCAWNDNISVYEQNVIDWVKPTEN